MGRPMVMGRKTWDSLPRKPLPVAPISLSPAAPISPRRVRWLRRRSKLALAAARGDALRRGVDEIAVIGGSEIFAVTLPLADRIEYTRVHAQPDGDVTFPPIDDAIWQELARRDCVAGPDDEADFTILTYARRRAASP